MKTGKMIRSAAALASTAAWLLLVAAQAGAHAKLVSVVPAADSSGPSPELIQVHFNEAVEVKLSTLKLTRSDGTPVAIMSMNEAKDPTTLSIMSNSPLPPGVYTASWSVVTDDGHKVSGSFKFTVK
jgi:methionine-rich copper-binding protein CopC